jgi:heptosyltransferase-2
MMATPALAHLRAAAPDMELHVLARRGTAGVLVDNPHVNSVIVADERKMPSGILTELRGNRYDAAMLLPNSLGSAWLAAKLRIPKRIGFARGGRRLLLTHPISYDWREWQTPTPKPLTRKSRRPNANAVSPRHMVEYYLRAAHETLRALGVAAEEPQADSTECLPALVLPVCADAMAGVEALLVSEGLSGAPLVGINPGAAFGGAKRWAAEELGQAADGIAGMLGAEIVSTAGPGERELTDAVAAHAKTRIHRLGEQLDLRGLAALLPRLRLLVTNDSGAMHMAAAVGTPVVAVFGPTDWAVTRPWSTRSVIVRNSPPCAPCFLRECPISHPCMKDVKAGEVVETALHLLHDVESPDEK